MLSADIAITDLFKIKALPNEDGNKCFAVECSDIIHLSDFSDIYLEYVKLIRPDVSWTRFRSAIYRSLGNSKAIVKLGGQFDMQSEDKARKFKVFKSTSCSLCGDGEHFYHCPHVIRVLLNMNPKISKIAEGKRCKVTIKDKTKGTELAGTSTMIERSSDDWSATSMKRINFTKVLSDYMGIKQLMFSWDSIHLCCILINLMPST